MCGKVFYSGLVAALFLVAPILFIACGSGADGLSRAEMSQYYNDDSSFQVVLVRKLLRGRRVHKAVKSGDGCHEEVLKTRFL